MVLHNMLIFFLKGQAAEV